MHSADLVVALGRVSEEPGGPSHSGLENPSSHSAKTFQSRSKQKQPPNQRARTPDGNPEGQSLGTAAMARREQVKARKPEAIAKRWQMRSLLPILIEGPTFA